MRSIATWVHATRPGFLSVTAVAVLIGLAAASRAGAALAPASVALTLIGAILAHAGANVLNDVHDARNGGDAINTARIPPFTGGSRAIQDGVIDARSMAGFGFALALAATAIGAILVQASGIGLFGFIGAGLILGLGYSAPPLALMSRGLGELAVAASWWLVSIGSAWVVLHRIDSLAMAASASFALMVAAILVVNQYPDRAADAAVGKRNWVVRLPITQARWIHPLLLFAAHALPGLLIALGELPPIAACSLVSLALAIPAARRVLEHAGEPARLRPAIVATIATTVVHGVAMAASLSLAAGRLLAGSL